MLKQVDKNFKENITCLDPMKDTDWIIIDTETTGLFSPIHIIEVAAQRMRGWEPVGEPYQAYLNHDVYIPGDAIQVHGLTEDFITKNGRNPSEVHAEFLDYIGSMPLVAHNLNYDWDKCLVPEWERLNCTSQAVKGLCAMLLARRVLPETKTVRLDALRDLFALHEWQSHSASGDVKVVVTLFQEVYGPRLQEAGIDTFDSVKEFSRLTPIKECHARFKGQATNAEPQEMPSSEPEESTLEKFSYYQFCGKSNLHKALNTLHGIISGAGMDGAVNDGELNEIRKWCDEHRRHQAKHPFNELIRIMDNALEDGVLDSEEIDDILWFLDKATSENEFYDIVTSDLQKLQGVLHGILADGIVEESEVRILHDWLDESKHLKGCYPYDEISRALSDVLADGVVDPDEAEYLKAFFSEFVSMSFSNQTKVSKELKVSVTALGVCAESPDIAFKQKKFCFTGESWKATRRELKNIVGEVGGAFTNRVTRDLDYLIYGASGNPCWAYSCYGRKVEKVLQMMKDGFPALIVHEDDFWKNIKKQGISFP